MHLYIQIAKTTHFHRLGNEWFRACWEVSQSLADAENLRLRDSANRYVDLFLFEIRA